MHQDMASQRIMKSKIKKKMIDYFRSKTDTQGCQHCSQESQFQLAQKPQIHFAPAAFASWNPNRALPLEPTGGPGPRPQDPLTSCLGASDPQCRVLTCILLPLEIILTSLETSGSVAKCQLFSKARYTCILIKEMLSTQA